MFLGGSSIQMKLVFALATSVCEVSWRSSELTDFEALLCQQLWDKAPLPMQPMLWFDLP